MNLDDLLHTAAHDVAGRAPEPALTATDIRALARGVRRRRRMGLVGALVMCVLVGLGVQSIDRTGAGEADFSTDDPTVGVTRVVDLSSTKDVPAGRYMLSFLGAAPDAPWAQVDVVAGFDVYNRAVFWHRGDAAPGGIAFWSVDEVAPDPCHASEDTYRDPGPGVEDLAEALMAQRGRVGKDPQPVTFAGYEGLYLEFAVPKNFDPEQCLGGVYESWRSTQYRFQIPAGGVDRIWILDAEGHRVVITEVHVPGVDPTFEAELASMLESITIGKRLDRKAPTTGPSLRSARGSSRR